LACGAKIGAWDFYQKKKKKKKKLINQYTATFFFRIYIGLAKSFGALVTLGATFLYACVYVLSDKVLSTTKPTPVPEKVCTMVGAYASVLTFIYLCVHTFPNWKTEVTDVIAARQGSTIGIVLVYPLLIISAMLHSLNYYVLLSRINNIAVGIMQSLRAVLVFVMSHYLFCGVSSTQCFNQWKFISAIVVIGCVTLFSLNGSPPSNQADSVQATPAIAAARAPSSNSRTSSPMPRHRSGRTSLESP
jgi:drug/metabolite transporter (DMT)-like permease